MANKISALDGSPLSSVGSSSAARGTPATPSGGPTVTTEGNSVHITGTAGQLAALEQTVSLMPAIDEMRVSAVQSAIEKRRYTISAEHVADRLIQIEYSLATLQGKNSPR